MSDSKTYASLLLRLRLLPLLLHVSCHLFIETKNDLPHGQSFGRVGSSPLSHYPENDILNSVPHEHFNVIPFYDLLMITICFALASGIVVH